MGQCYSVIARVKFLDFEEVVRRTHKYIKGERFAEGCFANSDLHSANGCFRAILAGDSQPLEWTEDALEDRWFLFTNDFECCCSWEGVIEDWFRAVAPALADGSEITVRPDKGQWHYVVRNGVAE